MPEHPHSLLLHNLVDPKLTSPKVYVGQVEAGDTVVMSEKGRHSAWHRFDTDIRKGFRTIAATSLRDRTRVGFKTRSTGFDIEPTDT